MVVDQIDKATPEAQYDPLGALYGLLEYDTAHSFTDEFAEVAIDASQVIWITTANDSRSIPHPILNPLNLFTHPTPPPHPGAGAHDCTPVEPGHPCRARMGASAGPRATRRCARPPGPDAAARDAARADDRVRQRPAGTARHGGKRRPAAHERGQRAYRIPAIGAPAPRCAPGAPATAADAGRAAP